MLRLGIVRESHWVEIGFGAAFLCKPATTALVTAARSRAGRKLKAMIQACEDAKAAGLPLEGADLADADVKAGYAFALSAQALAEELVEDWRGIAGADGKPAPFTPEGLVEVLAYTGCAEAFFAGATVLPDAIVAEGNA
jgi:hypothetical protein